MKVGGVDEPKIPVRIEGGLREVPLVPVAVLAEGDAALVLARRVLAQLVEPDAPRLLGVAMREPTPLIVLLGSTPSLPWVEGARYFGVEADAPRLRLSTTHRPVLDDGTPLPSALLERALHAQLGASARGPLLVTLRAGQPRAVSLAAARPIEVPLLRVFLGELHDGDPAERRG